jgi:hypothetical protein
LCLFCVGFVLCNAALSWYSSIRNPPSFCVIWDYPSNHVAISGIVECGSCVIEGWSWWWSCIMEGRFRYRSLFSYGRCVWPNWAVFSGIIWSKRGWGNLGFVIWKLQWQLMALVCRLCEFMHV